MEGGGIELSLLMRKPDLSSSNENQSTPMGSEVRPHFPKKTNVESEIHDTTTPSWRNKIWPGNYLRLKDSHDGRPAFCGWRKAVVVATITTAVVLSINVTLAVVAVSQSVIHDGVGLIYSGDCGTVKKWDTGLHLAINVLSTALLAASSFTMQCLSSPTRSEIDKAHQRGVSLDVGLPSLHNLFHVRVWKSLLWMSLCLATIPLHLLWNSTIFSTTATNRFSYVVATQGFLNGKGWITAFGGQKDDICHSASPMYDRENPYSPDSKTFLNDSISAILDDYNHGPYEQLSPDRCLDAYKDILLTSRRNLIVVVQPRENSYTVRVPRSKCGWGGELLWLSTLPSDNVIGFDLDVYPGMTSATSWLSPNFAAPMLPELQQQIRANGTWSVTVDISVVTCWSETRDVSHCQLQFVPNILIAVIVCNAIKLLCMLLCAKYLWNLEEPILATIGDAVCSFIEHPDDTTKGFCLLDLRAVNSGKVWMPKKSQLSRVIEAINKKLESWKVQDETWPLEMRKPYSVLPSEAYDSYYRCSSRRWLYSAISPTRWWMTMTLCTAYVVSGFVLWRLSLNRAAGFGGYSLSTLMSMRFGAADAGLILGLPGASGSRLLIDIIVANSFQLALSTTYYLYNSLYTAQYGALEWSQFVGKEPRPLRVTWPTGKQKSTYWLALPFRYGIPLIILSILLHFLVSQSIFLARIEYYDSTGQKTSDGFTDVGFSPRAILTTCLVGLLSVLVQIGHTCRPLDNRIPIHGNKSAVISALCHVQLKSDGDGVDEGLELCPGELEMMEKIGSITTGPLSWGVTRDPVEESVLLRDDRGREGAGHCSFGEGVLEPPRLGKRYR